MVTRLRTMYSNGHAFFPLIRSNILLVGTLGLDMVSITRLAVYLADRQLLGIDTSKKATLFDDLRAAYRQAACEARPCTIILQVSVRSNSLCFECVLSDSFHWVLSPQEVDLIKGDHFQCNEF